MRDGENFERARRLRSRSNLPEQRAWDALRLLRREGWPVRRQHPIGKIIVDFAIAKARLVIEIDGSIHERDFVAAKDAERDAMLKAAGWSILRVPVKDVLADNLLFLVRRVLASHGPSPGAAALRHPLPQAGEGTTEFAS